MHQENDKRPPGYIVLNRRHSREAHSNEDVKNHFKEGDLEVEDVNFQLGEILMTSPKLNSFFDMATSVTPFHVDTLSGINQQIANNFGQLKSAYDFYMNESDKTPSDRQILQKIFTKTSPFFKLMEETRGSMYGYYEAAEEVTKSSASMDPVTQKLWSDLQHEHTHFQDLFTPFGEYVKKVALALETEKPGSED
jgi:hypothetical protein